MTNAFDAYAEATKPAWKARKERIAVKRTEARAKTAAERQLEENDALLRGYNAWLKERQETLLASPIGREVKGLLTFLRTMTLSSAPALVRLVETASWMRNAEPPTRAELLWLIDRGITRLRVREGLPPFDDALPGEPDSAFLTIREALA